MRATGDRVTGLKKSKSNGINTKPHSQHRNIRQIKVKVANRQSWLIFATESCKAYIPYTEALNFQVHLVNDALSLTSSSFSQSITRLNKPWNDDWKERERETKSLLYVCIY